MMNIFKDVMKRDHWSIFSLTFSLVALVDARKTHVLYLKVAAMTEFQKVDFNAAPAENRFLF